LEAALYQEGLERLTWRAHSAEDPLARSPGAALPDLSDTELFMRTLASH
jgi:hypothetical protein